MSAKGGLIGASGVQEDKMGKKNDDCYIVNAVVSLPLKKTYNLFEEKNIRSEPARLLFHLLCTREARHRMEV